MKLLEIVRDEKFVRLKYQQDGLAAEIHNVTWHECPTPAFDKQLQALAADAAAVLEMNDAGVTIHEIDIDYSPKGTRSATIVFKKHLTATEKTHTLKTPEFRIDEPAEGERGARQCDTKTSKKIYKMLELAEKYAEGDRSQTLLPLADNNEEESDPEDGAALFTSGAQTA